MVFLTLSTLWEIFDRTYPGKKYIGAKAGGEVTISVKTFHFSGKYSTGPILQKKHQGAKSVTRTSVAETPQIMFLEMANFVGNICQVVTKEWPEIFDRTHTEEKT